MTKQAVTRLTPEEYAELVALAKREDRTVSYMVRRAVLDLLKKARAGA